MGDLFRFRILLETWPLLITGIGVTLVVSASALILSLLIGVPVGVMRLSKIRSLAWAAIIYIAALRNTPVLVQLIWVYYCLPFIIGVDLGPTLSCVTALALHGGAYVAEIIRAGIQSIERGQAEAGRSLGLGSWHIMRHIILPQALSRVLPPLANEGVTLLKYSSLVSTLGVADLTYSAQLVATTSFRPLEIYTFLAGEYLVLCTLLSYFVHRLEVRFKH